MSRPTTYKKAELSKPIAVKLKPDTLRRIDAFCAKLGEGRSMVMRLAMAVGLEGLEKLLSAPSADLSKVIYSLQSTAPALMNESSSSKGISGKAHKTAETGAQVVRDADPKKPKAP